jgi:ATP adenylyltransferase
MSYIERSKEGSKQPAAERASGAEECFLCRCRDESQDEENLVVKRGARTFVVLNRFPYNNGHLLIAPLAHKAALEELDDAESIGCMHEMTAMVAALTGIFRPDGFNIGLNLGRAAGAGVPGHLHWHIVPRWNGDTNFMTVIDDVRVIPQSLKSLWNSLRTALESQSAPGRLSTGD